MRDYIEISSVPYDENCLQVGEVSSNFLRQEAGIFKRQLERHFEPKHISFQVKSNPHDFGTYFDVVAYYDTENPEACTEAYRAEAECPAFWDEEANREIQGLYNQLERILT